MLYALRMAGECRVGGFSRQGTAMIKGVAILTMLFHHFFGMFGVRISPEQIQGDGVFAVLSWPAVRGYGVLCLELFAFVTGYGHGMIAAGETRSIFQATMARLKRFYPFFLAWCGVFVILCFIAPYPPVICTGLFIDHGRASARNNGLLVYQCLPFRLIGMLSASPVIKKKEYVFIWINSHSSVCLSGRQNSAWTDVPSV